MTTSLPLIYELNHEFNSLRAEAVERERRVMHKLLRHHVPATRQRVMAELEAKRLTMDAINARLCERRAELELNLYDGILVQPVRSVVPAGIPIYGSAPASSIVDAANATVFKNVLHHFKQLLAERREIFDEL